MFWQGDIYFGKSQKLYKKTIQFLLALPTKARILCLDSLYILVA